METSQEKSYQQAKKKVVLGTLALVLALPCFNFLWILHRLGPNLQAPRLIVEKITGQRQPASTPTPIAKENSTTPVIDIHCEKEHQKPTVQTLSATVRFRFVKCPQIQHISNSANLGQGHIFQVNNDMQTSDFLSLNEGANSVEVRFGKRVLQLMIYRNSRVSPDETRPAS